MESSDRTLMQGEKIAKHLKGMIHAPKQVFENGVDLTVRQIYTVEEPGGLDFGGSELVIAKRKKLPVEKRDKEDKYGWWNLKTGQYLMEFNEKLDLPKGKTVIVQSKDRMIKNKAFHPTIFITGGEALPLVCILVGSNGIKIKENARVSRLLII